MKGGTGEREFPLEVCLTDWALQCRALLGYNDILMEEAQKKKYGTVYLNKQESAIL